jgi:hypothetical protein
LFPSLALAVLLVYLLTIAIVIFPSLYLIVLLFGLALSMHTITNCCHQMLIHHPLNFIVASVSGILCFASTTFPMPSLIIFFYITFVLVVT